MTTRSKNKSQIINIILETTIDPRLMSYKITRDKQVNQEEEGLFLLPTPADLASSNFCTKCNSNIEVNVFFPCRVQKNLKENQDESPFPVVKKRKQRAPQHKFNGKIDIDETKILKTQSNKAPCTLEEFESGILKCRACGEDNFKSEAMLHRHTYTCKAKDNSQRNVSAWRRHEVTHFEHLVMDSQRKKICEICSKECANAEALRNHRRKVHKINLYVCAHCSKTFAFRQLLRDHLVVKHFPWLAPFSCSTCNQPFNQKETLKKHTNQVHNTEKFTCEICQKCLKLSSKTSHMARHKSMAEKKKFYCDICNKLFIRKLSMQNHRMSLHVDPKDWPFQCADCGQRLPHKGRLEIHKQSHSQENYCSVCGKTFRSRQNLQIHMNIHTDARPFVCKVCSKAFNDRSGLHSHLKQHEVAMGVKLTLNSEERRLKKIGIECG